MQRFLTSLFLMSIFIEYNKGNFIFDQELKSQNHGFSP